jgi:hypothetical protein
VTRHGNRARFAAAAVVPFVLCASEARADEDFDWLAVMYVWGADISVDARDQEVTAEFSDVIDKLEMSFMAHVEVQGNNVGGFLDYLFLGVGDNPSRQLADFNADLDLTATDLGLVWSPGAERMTGFEVFGGLRYVTTDFRLVVDPVPPALPTTETSVDDSYTDLLAGLRYIAPLGEQWRLIATGDLSAGETEGTWSVGAFGAYRVGPHHFYAGYRHMEVDVEGGAGEAVTQTFSGPVVAYGFSF